MIFESHAHFDDEAFSEDRDELLTSLHNQDIQKIVNVGSSLTTSQSSVALAEKYPFIYAAVGVHPSETAELNEDNFEIIRRLCNSDRTVAIGEIGLDYYWNEPDPEIQKKWFTRQLELAMEVKLPVIVHSRDAAQDTMQILGTIKNGELMGVMHCFSYSQEIAKEVLDLGWYLGIGGVVTFKNAKKLKEVVRDTPLNRLLLETDCPYLAPEPYRGKRNNSGYLNYVAEEIARIKEVEVTEVYEVTYQNAMDFFGIKA